MISEVDIETMMKDIEAADGNVEFIDESTQDDKFEPIGLFDWLYWYWFVR